MEFNVPLIPYTIGHRWVTPIAIVGVIVCGGLALVGLYQGLYKFSLMYTFFTGANVLTLWQSKKQK